MKHVGKNIPRPDGLAKVQGRAVYADDFTLPGLYHGMTVRSPHAHAKIESIAWNESAAPPDAVCVLAPDIRGHNGVLLLDDEWPVLARRFVHHIGEPVALVAARTRQESREAMGAVEVRYNPLDPVLTIEDPEGREPLHEILLQDGDLNAAFSNAAHIVEGEYRTGHQEHIYIECQGVTAWFDIDGSLQIFGTMQCPFYVLKAIVRCLGIPKESVRVKASAVGGGFGGKEDFPSMIAIHAALLARACGQPVKIMYDRHEDIIGTTKRHPSRVRHRTAFDKDGSVLAMDIDVVLDGGAYRTLSPVVLSRAVLHACGPYRVPAARIRGRVLRTNTPPNSAFRGFGAPQVEFAVERHLDRASRVIGVDPYEIRRINALRAGDRLPTGQVLDESTSILECLEEVERRTGFRARWIENERAQENGGDVRRGVGLSLFFHGSGFTGNGERKMHSPVTARLDEEGRIEFLSASTDMGQGCAVVLPQIAADATGLSLADLSFPHLDTLELPDSGPTVASRTTMIVGALVAEVGMRVREAVREKSRGKTGNFREIAREVRATDGNLETTVNYEPPPWHVLDEETYRGAAYPAYSWGADVAEVDVEADTLAVLPRRVTCVCEVGRVIHPAMCIGQIEGGTLQAVGHALWENIVLDSGRYVQDKLATYIIPTFADAPQIDVHLLEKPWSGSVFGAKGVGELPMDGGAAAIVQAIQNATGIEATEIPATPERLLHTKEESETAGAARKADR
jgi:CO/xanthine dehydrogenase Mo-binding subunit